MSKLVSRFCYFKIKPNYTLDSFQEYQYIYPKPGNNKIKIFLTTFRHQNPKFNVIYAHGNGEDVGLIAIYLTRISIAFSCTIIAYDYEGYGLSTGKASVKTAKRDAIAVYNAFITGKIPGIKKNLPLVLWGRSIGSLSACYSFDEITKARWRKEKKRGKKEKKAKTKGCICSKRQNSNNHRLKDDIIDSNDDEDVVIIKNDTPNNKAHEEPSDDESSYDIDKNCGVVVETNLDKRLTVHLVVESGLSGALRVVAHLPPPPKRPVGAISNTGRVSEALKYIKQSKKCNIDLKMGFVQVVHGTDDSIVRFRNGELLHKTATKVNPEHVCNPIWIEGGNHNDLMNTFREQMTEELTRFFKDYVIAKKSPLGNDQTEIQEQRKHPDDSHNNSNNNSVIASKDIGDVDHSSVSTDSSSSDYF